MSQESFTSFSRLNTIVGAKNLFSDLVRHLQQKHTKNKTMSSIASFAIRRTASASFKQQARYLSGTAVPVDVDHYTSGWDQSNFKDIGEFSKAGKYQIQTFNKISEKVKN